MTLQDAHLPGLIRRTACRLRQAAPAAMLALVLGTASTATLAAALLIRQSPQKRTEISFRDRRRFDGEGLGRIIVQTTFRAGAVRYDAAVYPTCVSTVAADPRPPEEAVPKWASHALLPWPAGTHPWPQADPDAGSGPSTEFTRVEAAGWPLLALWRWSDAPAGARPCAPGPAGAARPASAPPPAGLAGAAALQAAARWRPVWRGFFADTALFAGAWFIALQAPRLARAAARACGGRCAHCGYDLRGLIPVQPARVRCPECGRICRAPAPPPRRGPARAA